MPESTNPVIDTQNSVDDVLREFLDSPPAGTPLEVLNLVRDSLYAPHRSIPPKLFVAAVEQAPVAISIADTEGVILYANEAFTRVTGYRWEEIVGQNESMLSNRTTASTVYRKLWKKLLRKETWNGKLLNRRKSGELYLAEVTIAPVLNASGDTGYYLGMHRDVTAVHKLEQHVRNQKELIESVVELTPIAKLLISKDRDVVLSNRAYSDMAESFVGINLLEALIAQLCTFLGMTFEDICLAKREFHKLEFALSDADGEASVWLSCSGRWIQERTLDIDQFQRPGRHSHLLLVLENITQRKKRQEEERLAALRALIAEQETVDNLRETLSAAIHQFQAPLNMVGAAYGILQRKKNTNGENASLMDVLKHTLASGRDVLTKLRSSIPMQDQMQVMPVNINQMLKDLLSVKTNQLLEYGILVEWHPAAELPAVVAPVARTRGMFKQLIDNAIEAIRVRNSTTDERRELFIGTCREESEVRIDIADSGDGIPQELRLKIFEPFFSTKENGGHGGMGLAMVQEVVSMLNGIVYIDPAYTGGTRIIVRLPFEAKENR